jgi:aldose sugar dehydrogenase
MASGLSSTVRGEITNAPGLFKKTQIKVEEIATGLEHPWGLQFLPDGRMLVTERPGRLRIVSRDGKVSAPVAGLPRVHARNQGGLLDIALAPDFDKTGTVYFAYSEPRSGFTNGTTVNAARLVMTDGGGRLEDSRPIFRQLPAVSGGHHYGARIVARADGSLFITLGERYSERKEAQNPANHLGKVVRIMPDGSAPVDNPRGPGWAPEVWSIGHRNIQGAALDPATGQLWTVEHGAMGGDELNHPEAGKNYGWPIITYGRDYTGAKIGEGTAKAGMEQPVYYWDPSIATSGLAFYTGDLFPQWKGSLLVGGLAGAQLARLVVRDGAVLAEEKLLTDRGWRIRDVRQGPDEAVWLLTDEPDGKLVRLTPVLPR